MDETKNDEVTDSNRSEEGQEGDQLVFNWVDETSEGNQSEIGEGLNPPGEQEQSVEGIEFRTGGSDAEPAGEMENASQQSDKDLSATQDESNEEKNAELPNENSPERDELLEELQSVSMRVGMPVFRFNMKDVGRFDPGAYEEEFGSWDAALQAAGLNESEDEDSVETESEDRSHEHDSDKDSPINSDRGRSLSTDEGNKSAIKPLDALPEGRIPELTVTVNEVNESANERREAELSVTLESGDKVTMVVWSVHDIDASWTVGQRYRLEEVRHKSWSSDGVHNHRLSSSVDLSMTPITDTGDSADSGLDSENDDQNSRIDSMLEDIDFESSS